MAGIAALASPGVGAGESLVRVPNRVEGSQPTDRAASPDDARGAALKLIQRALSRSEATGNDLDVLA